MQLAKGNGNQENFIEDKRIFVEVKKGDKKRK
jgi:hypothetical protein